MVLNVVLRLLLKVELPPHTVVVKHYCVINQILVIRRLITLPLCQDRKEYEYAGFSWLVTQRNLFNLIRYFIVSTVIKQ